MGWTRKWMVDEDYRIEQQSYVSRAGGDEGDQGGDGRTVIREM